MKLGTSEAARSKAACRDATTNFDHEWSGPGRLHPRLSSIVALRLPFTSASLPTASWETEMRRPFQEQPFPLWLVL